MPKTATIQTNFTAGEISPRLLGRVDVAKFQNACKLMRNAVPLVHGGARRRGGSRFRAEVKDSTQIARLFPYVYSRTQAYIFELGNAYARVYNASGRIESSPGVPVEFATPYAAVDLFYLRYVQSGDALFLSAENYFPRRVQRFSDTLWKLSNVPFRVQAAEEVGDKPATTLTLSATTGVVTATAGAICFEAADVGRQIIVGAGIGTITGYTSQTVVTVTVVDAFASVGPHASQQWTLLDSPFSALTPSIKEPVGAAVTLTAGTATWKNSAQVTDVGKLVGINDGLVEITGFTSTTIVSGIIRSILLTTTAASAGAWDLRSKVWTAANGYPRACTWYEQRLCLAGSIKFPQTIWGSRTGDYLDFTQGAQDDDGFSFTIASDQVNSIEHLATARVLLALTLGGEFTMQGGNEKPLAPTNVQIKSQSVYGCSQARPIRVGNEILFISRTGRKIHAMGYRVDDDAYKAPDISVLAEHITLPSLDRFAYAQEPDKVAWGVRGDGTALSLSIDRDQDAIGFAQHDTIGVIEDFAVMPTSSKDQVWAIVRRTINGVERRYVETWDEADNLNTDCAVTATTRKAVAAAIWGSGKITVTVAAHGYSTGNMIKHFDFLQTVDGERIPIEGVDGTTLSITVVDVNNYTIDVPDAPGPLYVVGATVSIGALSWPGFSHLEGATVDVKGDGCALSPVVVSGGYVTLARIVHDLEAGLHYDTEITLLPPELSPPVGTVQGAALSIHKILGRFYNTQAAKCDGEDIPFRQFGEDVLDQPPPHFTGDKPVTNWGWGRAGSGDSDGSVTFGTDKPLDFQLLAVIRRLTVNDG